MTDLAILNGLMEMLAETRSFHASTTHHYRFLSGLCRAIFQNSPLTSTELEPVQFEPFGALTFPYRKMGAIDTIDLFGLDELIIFAFYWANRGRYRRTVDIGANLGLHSILMHRCGFAVTAFEPDPVHFELLSKNLMLNKSSGVTPVREAISDQDGTMEFVRVKGNTTGSHLAGAKTNPYGDLDRFDVVVRKCMSAVVGADFVKIDAEGHEVTILKSISYDRWSQLDAMVEIGTPKNARDVFDHFMTLKVRMFSQKTGWTLVSQVEDVPTSHREGSLFITSKADMPWS